MAAILYVASVIAKNYRGETVLIGQIGESPNAKKILRPYGAMCYRSSRCSGPWKLYLGGTQTVQEAVDMVQREYELYGWDVRPNAPMDSSST